MMDHYKNFSNSVATMLLSERDIDQRIEYLMAWIDLAEALNKIRNYLSSAAIIDALQSPAICRLSKTWGQISEESEEIFNDYKKLYFSRKFGKFLLDSIDKTPSPTIPY